MSDLKTPLYDFHVKLGAKMVEFSGWQMPLQYEGIKKEHLEVRESAGMFDVSHMLRLIFEGDKAADFLNYLFTNHILDLAPRDCQYNLMLKQDGFAVDDLVVY